MVDLVALDFINKSKTEKAKLVNTQLSLKLQTGKLICRINHLHFGGGFSRWSSGRSGSKLITGPRIMNYLFSQETDKEVDRCQSPPFCGNEELDKGVEIDTCERVA